MRAAIIGCVMLVLASCSGSARVEVPLHTGASSPPQQSISILPQQSVPANAAAREDAARACSVFVGRPAPDFTLVDASGRLVALASHRGHYVVVRFFPPEDLPDCVCNADADSDSLWRMQEIDAAVLAIGPFAPAKAAVLAHKYGLAFTLLCDESHAVAEAYDGFPDEQGRATIRRQTFIVAPDGTIAAHWPLIVPEGHAARVKAWIDAHRE